MPHQAPLPRPSGPVAEGLKGVGLGRWRASEPRIPPYDGQAAGVHVREDLRCTAGMEYRRSAVDPPCSGEAGL